MRLLRSLLLGGCVLAGCARDQRDHVPTAAERSNAAAQKFVAPAPKPVPSSKSPRKNQTPPPTATPRTDSVVNPLVQPVGKVASVNANLRFVVIDFSLSRVPEVEQRLNVYRQGQKVGEVRISGPTLNQNTVADIVAGEAQTGDEVRAD
jgi:hypothetical protein